MPRRRDQRTNTNHVLHTTDANTRWIGKTSWKLEGLDTSERLGRGGEGHLEGDTAVAVSVGKIEDIVELLVTEGLAHVLEGAAEHLLGELGVLIDLAALARGVDHLLEDDAHLLFFWEGRRWSAIRSGMHNDTGVLNAWLNQETQKS